MTSSHFERAGALRPGSIVLFRFPERHDALSGKRRPCMVLATELRAEGVHIALAYGTSATTDANRGFDIEIEAEDDCQGAGLRRATRFVLARRITVRASDERFDSSAQALIIGELPAHRMRELEALTDVLGQQVFDDHSPLAPRARAAWRRRDAPPQVPPSRKHRTLLLPAPVARGRRGRSTSTVIVEYRFRQVPRPPSAA